MISMLVIQFLVGIAWASLTEYVSHRFLLHSAVRRYPVLMRLFGFHLEHHKIVMTRELCSGDETYDELWFRDTNRRMEVYGLVTLLALHSPLVFFFPAVYIGSFVYTVAYYLTHLKMHQDTAWGWHWFPWHMEHHFRSARSNFGVVTPLWDRLFFTRRKS